MDPITIIALTNLGIQVVAMAIDAYQKSGATKEEVDAMRAQALDRLSAAISGVENAEPPKL